MKFQRHPIEEEVKSYAEGHGLCKVLVALSGGPDSISVAFALKKAGIEITALHCNFHLRGEESDRDMKFVELFCNDNSIPLQSMEFDVMEYVRANKGISIEMACRTLRHEWFKEIYEKSQWQRLVTGHNADDNIETFFLNLLRGAGTRGLKGMDSDNGYIWRPLLNFHRKDIIDYIEQNKLRYVVDSTNLQSDFRRNFIRNRIIPLFKEEWKGFDSVLRKSLNNLSAENKVVEESLLKNLPREGDALSVETILNFPAPLLLIKRFIDSLEPFSTTPMEVLMAIRANKPHIRIWKLKKGKLLLRNRQLILNPYY